MADQDKEIEAAFRKVGLDIFQAMARGVLVSAIQVANDAKENAPKITGNLRRSITYTQPDIDKARMTAESIVGTNVEYAPIVELGTSKRAPKPYLKPALESNQDNIRMLIAESIRTELQ